VSGFIEGRGDEHPLTNALPNAFINALPLRRGGETRAPNGSRATFWDAQPAPTVSTQLITGHHIILSEVGRYQCRGQIEEERGINFITVHGF
jgi:hypothetical protein